MSTHGQAALLVRHGHAVDEIVALARALGAQSVFAANDYEPQTIARDHQLLGALADVGVALHMVKDQVIFERREILSKAGSPYTVFTPYLKTWLARLDDAELRPRNCLPYAGALAPRPPSMRQGVPSLADVGFEKTNLRALHIEPGAAGASALIADFMERIDDYHTTRDFPAVKGPSYLGMHLRFGTVSIRTLVALARRRSVAGSPGAGTWLSELVWREFYSQILANFPHVVHAAFKPEFDTIKWEHGAHARQRFQAWCLGRTGFPIVDAAMAQINQSGYMHNRLRMLAGSFLVKDLGLDWRWGERYFAQHLNDFDLSANNGGWQWVASCGCDAQPWFRIFNPVRQSQTFDPQGKFIRRYLPQLAELAPPAMHAPWLCGHLELDAAGVKLGQTYPRPIIEHESARARTLQRYALVRGHAPRSAANSAD